MKGAYRLSCPVLMGEEGDPDVDQLWGALRPVGGRVMRRDMVVLLLLLG